MLPDFENMLTGGVWAATALTSSLVLVTAASQAEPAAGATLNIYDQPRIAVTDGGRRALPVADGAVDLGAVISSASCCRCSRMSEGQLTHIACISFASLPSEMTRSSLSDYTDIYR